jgi:hypothetical protein
MIEIYKMNNTVNNDASYCQIKTVNKVKRKLNELSKKFGIKISTSTQQYSYNFLFMTVEFDLTDNFRKYLMPLKEDKEYKITDFNKNIKKAEKYILFLKKVERLFRVILDTFKIKKYNWVLYDQELLDDEYDEYAYSFEIYSSHKYREYNKYLEKELLAYRLQQAWLNYKLKKSKEKIYNWIFEKYFGINGYFCRNKSIEFEKNKLLLK